MWSSSYFADIVGNGLDAVQAAKDFDYDIILMDIFMPGDQEKFLSAGMDDYLAKPLNKSTLIKMLNKWILQEAGT